MNRNVFTYIILSISMLLMASCDRDSRHGATGTLSLGFIEDAGVNVKTDAATKIYSMKVYNKADELVYSVEDYTTVTDVKLAEGTYTVVAESQPDPTNPLGSPKYQGTKSVTIKSNTRTSVSIVCTLANVKLGVKFSQQLIDNFSDYSVTFESEAAGVPASGVVFGANDSGKDGYIMPKDGVFKLTLRLTNKQGGTAGAQEFEVIQTIKDAEPRDYYRFNFDVSPDGSLTDGGGAFKLTINTDLDVIEHNFEIKLDKLPAPTLVGEGFDLSNPVIVNVDKRGAAIRINATADANIQEFTITHNNETLINMGIPTKFELGTLDPAIKVILNKNGITWSESVSNATSAWIDFSALANTVELGEYFIDVRVLDAQRQLVKKTLNFNVAPDMDLVLDQATAWAKFADLKGEWFTLAKPQNMTFEYTLANAENWTKVPLEQIVYDDANKLITTHLNGLDASATYRFRMVGESSSGVPYRSSNIMNVTTEAAPEIPNLKFEDWHQEGKTVYPNASGGNSFWATGNKGVNSFLAGSKNSNTYSVEGEGNAVSGKAAYMESIKPNVVAIAAGNLFIGDFVKISTNPKDAIYIGRPYTGRPLKLKGWYKYTKVGDDVGHIYMWLKKSGTQIAYGELKITETVGQYTQFEIALNYSNTTVIPDEVAIVTTSSINGDSFGGWVGSKMWVDEFELVWD